MEALNAPALPGPSTRFRRRLALVAGAGLAGALLGCGAAPAVEPTTRPLDPMPAAPAPVSAPKVERASALSEAALRRHVAALTTHAMAGRAGGSAGELEAARYVAQKLESFGFEEVALEPFELAGGGESVNVVATAEGHAPGVIVVGAHIDHLGVRDGVIYHGAEDNASGVAVVLEIARALSGAKLGRAVIFAFFGAEEIGLQGSRHFVRTRSADRPVTFMVNVDMIGRRLVDRTGLGWLKSMVGIDDARAVGAVGTRDRPALRALVDEAFRSEGLQVWAAEDLPPLLSEWVARQANDRGDNASFEHAGIETIFFGSGEFDEYHQPGDTPDKLVWPLMAARARAIRATVQALSEAEFLP